MLASTYQAQLRELHVPEQNVRALVALPIILPFTEAGISPAEKEAVVEASRKVTHLNPEEASIARRFCEEPLTGDRRELALGCLEELCRAEDVTDLELEDVRLAFLACDHLIQHHTRHSLGASDQPPSRRNTEVDWPELGEDLVSEARSAARNRLATRFGVRTPEENTRASTGSHPEAEGGRDAAPEAGTKRRRGPPIRRIRTAMRTEREQTKEGGLI